jgi:hypothetical protein
MIRMLKVAWVGVLALAVWGCSSKPAVKPMMPMDGVAELPAAKNQQVATYRCSLNLASGQAEVGPGKRMGKDEEAAWKILSSKLKQGNVTYEVVIEDEKAGKSTDWAMVTVLETETGSGKVIRKLPVYEFWGAHDRHSPRALMMKDGHLQFFVQFWTAD